MTRLYLGVLFIYSFCIGLLAWSFLFSGWIKDLLYIPGCFAVLIFVYFIYEVEVASREKDGSNKLLFYAKTFGLGIVYTYLDMLFFLWVGVHLFNCGNSVLKSVIYLPHDLLVMIPGFLLIVIVLGIGISVEIIINRKLSNVFLAYVAGALVGFSIFIGSIYLYVQLKSKYPQVVSPIEKILKPCDNYNESVDEERR